jgi:hypothetical protein
MLVRYEAAVQIFNEVRKREGGQPLRGATSLEIAAAERACGTIFPQELVHWLSWCRGATFRGNWTLFGIDPRQASTIPSLLNQIKHLQGRVPVAGDVFGNYFCLSLDHDGMIGFVEGAAADEIAYAVATRLEVFIYMFAHVVEVNAMSVLGDREFMCAVDPTLKDIQGLTLPWTEENDRRD